MLNQVVLVGRIVNKTKLGEDEHNKITIAVPRSLKNENDEYDFIDCTVFNNVAENIKEYCKPGDLIGVKGRVARLENEVLHIVAERVTFLSQGNNNDNDI